MDVLDWFPEFKVSAETDNDLQSYFFKLPEVQKIIDSDFWLVLGRKGVGKTAIYEYLRKAPSKELNGYNTICISFGDYPWPAHKLYKESLAGELSAYQQSWRYLFFVKAVSRLIELKESKGDKLNQDLKWAKNYIEIIYGNPDPSLSQIMISKLCRVSKVKGPGVDLENLSVDLGAISIEDIAQDKALQSQLRSNAFTLLRFFEKIFKENCKGYKILIALDQLDEAWLKDGIKEYSKVLINLVNVCRSISSDDTLAKNIKVIPFLRTDIYDSLIFNDKNKLLQDSAIILSWNSDSLDEMFFARVKKYFPVDQEIDIRKRSGNLFDVEFVRQGTPVFKYVTRRSFFRPRDIVVYFNKIREIHKRSKNGLYSSTDLYDADKNASISIYNEIVDEWANQFPEIETLLSVLQTIGIETFNYKTFCEKCDIGFGGIDEVSKRKYLSFLFDNSIIGQKKQGRWEYLCSVPNLKLNIEKDFRIHQALKYRLQLVEKRPNQKI